MLLPFRHSLPPWRSDGISDPESQKHQSQPWRLAFCVLLGLVALAPGLSLASSVAFVVLTGVVSRFATGAEGIGLSVSRR